MRSRRVIADVRRYAARGWGPPDPFQERDNQRYTGLVNQKAAYIVALTYIADEAGPADILTIKRLAHIALGREHD